jgi:hypothetical protein
MISVSTFYDDDGKILSYLIIFLILRFDLSLGVLPSFPSYLLVPLSHDFGFWIPPILLMRKTHEGNMRKTEGEQINPVRKEVSFSQSPSVCTPSDSFRTSSVPTVASSTPTVPAVGPTGRIL